MRKLLRPPSSPFDIQPDTLIFSDLHLHERKEFEKVDEITGLNSRLVEGLDILKQIVDILNTHPEIKWVYFLGDWFELKDKVPNHLLLELQRMLEGINNRGDLLLTSLIGNHDFNIPKYPTIKLFDINLVTQPEWWSRKDDVKVGFIPFQREFKDFLSGLKEINSNKPDIVFFHQEIPGVTYETGREIPGRMDSHLFLPETLYLSGHIHKCQAVGKVQYVGSPYQVRFSDEGQSRYIWLLNSKTRKLAPIKLNYPEFKSINIKLFQAIISEGQPTWQELENYFPNNYIRIIGDVPASQWDPNFKRDIRSKLEGAGARGISFQIQVIKQHQAQIPPDMVEDNDSIINLYVQDNVEGSKLNQDELIRVGLEIFKQ